MLDKSAIVKKFKLDVETWPFCFALEFQDKYMKLSARTLTEYEQWLRIFGLIVRMKREGLEISSMNPFTYEEKLSIDVSHFGKRKLTDTQMIE